MVCAPIATAVATNAARRLHVAYLEEMWRLAREDGVITNEERADLDALAALLTAALPR